MLPPGSVPNKMQRNVATENFDESTCSIRPTRYDGVHSMMLALIARAMSTSLRGAIGPVGAIVAPSCRNASTIGIPPANIPKLNASRTTSPLLIPAIENDLAATETQPSQSLAVTPTLCGGAVVPDDAKIKETSFERTDECVPNGGLLA